MAGPGGCIHSLSIHSENPPSKGKSQWRHFRGFFVPLSTIAVSSHSQEMIVIHVKQNKSVHKEEEARKRGLMSEMRSERSEFWNKQDHRI